MSAMKITFLPAIAGHLLCGVYDCMMTYMPGGRFHFEDGHYCNFKLKNSADQFSVLVAGIQAGQSV